MLLTSQIIELVKYYKIIRLIVWLMSNSKFLFLHNYISITKKAN